MKNNELIEALKAAVRREREATSEVLRFLREVERRQIYLERGYSSLFVFCTKELSYSEQEAHIRIQAMRLVKAVPEAEARIERGELSLTVAAMVNGAVRREGLPPVRSRELVSEMAGASKREAEKKLAAHFPEAAKPEKAMPISEELVEIRFTVTKEEAELFQKLMDRKAHSNFERSHAKLFVALAGAEMKKLDGKNAAPALSPDKVTGRYIQAATRRKIWKRDEARCQFKSKSGQQCQERHGLQLDHIQPFALGGASTEENLRLLCGAHNRWRQKH